MAIVIPEIAIAAAVPMMVVLDAAAVAIPVAGVETLSIVARGDPASGRVAERSISGMPLVVVANGNSAAVYPDEIPDLDAPKNAGPSGRRGGPILIQWNLGRHKRGQEYDCD